MANGLQSLATVKEDTEVRDRFIDDSLKSYNPDALTDFEYTPSGEYYENYSKPNRPQSVNIPPDIDPFSETPFNVSPFTGLEQDLSNIKIDAPIIDIATAIGNLKLDESGDPNNPVSVYASNELQNPKKQDWEQETAVKLALLNNNLGALDFTNPNVIEHFKTFGINLESDTPSISAGLESQSSRTAKHFETYGIDLEQPRS